MGCAYGLRLWAAPMGCAYGLLRGPHPLQRRERRRVQPYAQPLALDLTELAVTGRSLARLQASDNRHLGDLSRFYGLPVDADDNDDADEDAAHANPHSDAAV